MNSLNESNGLISVQWRTNPYTGEWTWTYGNWGGKGWSAGQFTPPGQEPNWDVGSNGPLDAIFKANDRAYQNIEDAWNASSKSKQDIADYWRSTIAADNQMRQSIHDLEINNGWGNTQPGGQVPDVNMANAALQADRAFALKAIHDLQCLKYLENPDGKPAGGGGDPHSGLPWPNDDLITDLQKQFATAATIDPIVLDLDGDGVETTALSKSASAGVHFNLDAKGLAENTSWVGKDDGLLVRDLDGDGKITSGRELFGNHTLLSQGTQSSKEAANGDWRLAA